MINCDPDFRNVTSASDLPGQVELSEHWTLVLEAEESATQNLTIVGLLHDHYPFENAGVNSFGFHPQCGSAVEFDPRFRGARVQVLPQSNHFSRALPSDMDTADWRRPYFPLHKLRLKASGRREDGVWTMVARAGAIRLAREKYRLCILFDNPKELILRSRRGEVHRHDAAAAVDPAGINQVVTNHEACPIRAVARHDQHVTFAQTRRRECYAGE